MSEVAAALWFLGFTILIAVVAVGVRGYLTQKGANLATKEDIAGITSKIEAVKASVGSRLNIHHFRYQQEFAILLELSEKLVAARDAIETIHGEGDHDAEFQTLVDLQRFIESRKSFLPEEIAKALEQMNAIGFDIWLTSAKRYHEVDGDTLLKEWWDNLQKVKQIAAETQDEIRKRVRDWEAFEPGP